MENQIYDMDTGEPVEKENVVKVVGDLKETANKAVKNVKENKLLNKKVIITAASSFAAGLLTGGLAMLGITKAKAGKAEKKK